MECLNKLREQIDEIDQKMIELMQQRLELAKEVAKVKKEIGKPVFDAERETIKLASVRAQTREEYQENIERIYQFLMDESKEVQKLFLKSN